jgi:hypothetical protein
MYRLKILSLYFLPSLLYFPIHKVNFKWKGNSLKWGSFSQKAFAENILKQNNVIMENNTILKKSVKSFHEFLWDISPNRSEPRGHKISGSQDNNNN